jgi:hypothetical protein
MGNERYAVIAGRRRLGELGGEVYIVVESL